MKIFQIKYLVFFIILIVVNCLSQAQSNGTSSQHAIDSLKGILKTQQDDTNKVNTLNRLSNKLEELGNYDSSSSFAKKAESIAGKIGFKSGLARAFVNIGNNYIDQGNYPKALEYQLKALDISQESGNKRGISNALGNIGNIYFNQGNNPKALEYQLKALSIDEELDNKYSIAIELGNIGNIYSSEADYPRALEYDLKSLAISQKIGDKVGVSDNLGNIGNVYYTQVNYPKALEYDLKALAITQEIGDKNGTATNLGNIGNIYFDQGNYPKALEYYAQAQYISQKIGDKEGTAINLGNIGNIYTNIRDYTKALEYDLQSLSIGKQIDNKGIIDGAYINLGRAYTKQRNYNLAKKYLDSTIDLSRKTGDKKHAQEAYDIMAQLDSAAGNYKLGWDNYRKYILYRDSITNTESIKKIAQLGVSYEFEKREDSIKVNQEKADIIKTAESNRKSIITCGAIVIALLALILAIVLINRQQIKHKKDKIILEKERQHIEDELTNSHMLLDGYIQNMVNKNTLIEQFKLELEELKNLKSKEIDEKRVERIEYLNNATILTDEDWNKFKTLFEQVYKGFFIRLKEKLPDLTQSEIRLASLTKLQLETKQMAGILGVSLNTIKQTRYRLRKKLDLTEEDSLDAILESI